MITEEVCSFINELNKETSYHTVYQYITHEFGYQAFSYDSLESIIIDQYVVLEYAADYTRTEPIKNGSIVLYPNKKTHYFDTYIIPDSINAHKECHDFLQRGDAEEWYTIVKLYDIDV